MNKDEYQPDETELHAYLDDQLDAQRRLRFEEYLSRHPELHERLRDYRQIGRALHERFDYLLEPPRKLPSAPSPGGWAVWARAAALVMVSLACGWWARGTLPLPAQSDILADLARPAAFAHTVYADDARYPVELSATTGMKLHDWIRSRMDADIQAPDLGRLGFNWLGGRLLPSTNRMAAQFMYESASGERITLYVRHWGQSREKVDFKYRTENDLGMFYWIEGNMAYALVGRLSPQRLIEIARRVQSAAPASAVRDAGIAS